MLSDVLNQTGYRNGIGRPSKKTANIRHKTQNEDKQNKEHNTENLKDYQYRCQKKNKTQNEDKQNKEHNTENLKDYQYRCQKKHNTE